MAISSVEPGGGDGGGLVVPVGHGDPAALTALSTTAAANHLRRGGSLIEQDQAIQI